MKTITVTLPEKLGMELENYVKSGWFTDEGELVRTALQEFIRHNRLEGNIKSFMKKEGTV